MLYGANKEGKSWRIREDQNKERFLVFNGNNEFSNIPMEKLTKSILKYGKNPEMLHYYVFPYHGETRFVFMAEENISFQTLDDTLMRWEQETCFMVIGALYDLKKGKFLNFGKKNPFLEYVLYDTGIPNTIYDEENYFFTTMVFQKNSNKIFYYVTDSTTDPSFVSRVYFGKNGEIKLSRVIFMDEAFDGEIAIILSDEMELDFTINQVTLSGIGYVRSKRESEKEYFVLCHHAEETLTHMVPQRTGIFRNKHIIDSDAIVLCDKNGTFGEHAFLRFDKGKVSYNIKDSFMLFEKITEDSSSKLYGHNVYKVIWRKNDFENGYAYEDITTGITYESDREYEAAKRAEAEA